METDGLFSCLQSPYITQTNKIVIAFTSASTIPTRLNCCECIRIWLTSYWIIDLFRRILLCSWSYVTSSSVLLPRCTADEWRIQHIAVQSICNFPDCIAVKVLASFSNQLERILGLLRHEFRGCLSLYFCLVKINMSNSPSSLRAAARTYSGFGNYTFCMFDNTNGKFCELLNFIQTPCYRSANFFRYVLNFRNMW